MAVLKPFPWQQHQWRQLQQARQQQRLPHALLLSGSRGLGKSAFALALAQALLCPQTEEEGTACGRCRACRLFEAGTHPDFRRLAPQEESSQIRIDAVRQLLEESVLSVGEARRRVFVLEPADALGGPAANALLKTLEEPLAGIHLLLLSAYPERLPITLRSRCQQVRFLPPPVDEATDWLERDAGVSGERARLLLQIAGGAPLAALEMAESGAAERYQVMATEFLALARGQGDPLGLAESWLKQVELDRLQGYMASWLLRVIRQCLENRGAEGVAEDVPLPCRGTSLRRIYRLLDNLFEMKRNLDHNLNAQLVLERLLLEWHEIAGGAH
jgi:DNA polymerase-3 subunit delta'